MPVKNVGSLHVYELEFQHMSLRDAIAVRSHAESPLSTTWQPIDLICEVTEPSAAELVVRSKLVRSPVTAAVCVSEAVAHHILAVLGLTVADAYAVQVGSKFAQDLTNAYGYSPPVMAGRHWGTRLILDALETTLHESHLTLLSDPTDVFLVYLADVITAYGDRNTHGNVLLVPSPGGVHLKLLPIDQSDCFGGPETLSTSGALSSKRDRSFAEALPGMERLILDYGTALIDNAVARVKQKSTEIISAAAAAPDEWYDRASANPDDVMEFLAYRLEHLETLARLELWRGMSTFSGGNYDLL